MNYCVVLWIKHVFCDHSAKVPSVSNQLAERHEEVTIPSQTGTIQVPRNEEPAPKNEESITSFINETYEGKTLPDGYAVVDTEDVRECLLSCNSLLWLQIQHIFKWHIPYSLNISREKIFTDFKVVWLTANHKNFILKNLGRN